jgi:hypothetical protein
MLEHHPEKVQAFCPGHFSKTRRSGRDRCSLDRSWRAPAGPPSVAYSTAIARFVFWRRRRRWNSIAANNTPQCDEPTRGQSREERHDREILARRRGGRADRRRGRRRSRGRRRGARVQHARQPLQAARLCRPCPRPEGIRRQGACRRPQSLDRTVQHLPAQPTIRRALAAARQLSALQDGDAAQAQGDHEHADRALLGRPVCVVLAPPAGTRCRPEPRLHRRHGGPRT